MDYSELNRKFSEKKINQLKNKGYMTVDDVVRIRPAGYCDYRTLSDLATADDGKHAFKVTLVNCTRGMGAKAAYTKAHCEDENGEKLTVTWFDRYKYSKIKQVEGKTVIVAGNFNNSENWGKQMTNPDVFDEYRDDSLRIYPVYKKIPNMSEEYFMDVLNTCIDEYKSSEVFTSKFLSTFKVCTLYEMITGLHRPKDENDIKRANYRYVLEKFYPFCRLMVEMSDAGEKKSDIIPKNISLTKQVMSELPFELTKDQKTLLNRFYVKAAGGERVNALVQGDVGSGKTICALLLMLMCVGNGYQAVLMAPTGVLAKQHYEEISRLTEKHGIKTVLLTGGMKASEKNKVLPLIEDGEADIIVGTHSVISENVRYKNLGITVVDEEHKFGVKQREQLKEKAKDGVHNISMSATPIPRSLARTLYADCVDIYTIESKPVGRKPVKTAAISALSPIFKFMKKEVEAGHQCYIVCPLIESGESGEDEVYSVEDVKNMCTYYFSGTGIKTAVVTGKMKEGEKAEALSAFERNEYQVLLASTVIEVGVNVPNATVITIMNAERFGLAGLHQLRGRVGRSSLQSYCILQSKDKENERLKVMCDTTDGFIIAEKDMELRGTGDIVGIKQSGNDENLELMLKYPKLYSAIKEYIRKNH